MCSREMNISSAWNSVETKGQVAKKQPLCVCVSQVRKVGYVEEESGDACG